MSTPTSKLIALTGGIGSGKSVVARILRAMGYPVYDCDLRARQIIDADPAIHALLQAHIHPEAVVEGIVNRALISSIVFADSDALQRLNTITHSAVRADLLRWRQQCEGRGQRTLFVETAILRQSGFISLVDDIWEITAPIDIRIQRVQQRSHLTPAQIQARIQSQASESLSDFPHRDICNAPTTSILPQIHTLLASII